MGEDTHKKAGRQRADRLEKALRANLQRRKQKARELANAPAAGTAEPATAAATEQVSNDDATNREDR